MTQVKADLAKQKKRVTGWEYLLGASKSDNTFKNKFDDMYGKVEESNKIRLGETMRLDQKISELESKLSIDNQDAGKSMEQLNKNSNDLATLRNEMNDFLSNTNELKTYCLERISESNKSIFEDLTNLNNKVAKLSLKDSKYSIDFLNIDQEVKLNCTRVHEWENSFGEINVLLDNMDKTKLDKKDVDRFTGNVEDQLLKYSIEFEECMNQYKTTENFVEKYIPISIQNLISEWLKNVFKPGQIILLEDYERHKYNKFYQKILEDDGTPNIKELASKLTEAARTRNSPGKFDSDCKELEKSEKKVEEIIDYNEIAISNLESDLRKLQTKYSVKIRDMEEKLKKSLKEAEVVNNNNYGELTIFCQTLQEEIDGNKNNLRGENLKIWNEVKKMKLDITAGML